MTGKKAREVLLGRLPRKGKKMSKKVYLIHYDTEMGDGTTEECVAHFATKEELNSALSQDRHTGMYDGAEIYEAIPLEIKIVAVPLDEDDD